MKEPMKISKCTFWRKKIKKCFVGRIYLLLFYIIFLNSVSLCLLSAHDFYLKVASGKIYRSQYEKPGLHEMVKLTRDEVHMSRRSISDSGSNSLYSQPIKLSDTDSIVFDYFMKPKIKQAIAEAAAAQDVEIVPRRCAV